VPGKVMVAVANPARGSNQTLIVANVFSTVREILLGLVLLAV
jgi:hypothetical protein